MRQFHISQILDAAAVIPGEEYKVIDIHNVIYRRFNKIPSIHCGSTNDGSNYLSEIRLCFSKSLELIDCRVTGNSEVVYKSIATHGELLTNCDLHKAIIYADTFPSTDFATSSKNSRLQMNWQKFVDFLKQALL